MSIILSLTRSLMEKVIRKRKTILLIVVVATLTLIISTAISVWLATTNSVSFPSVGNIRAIGVKAFNDSALTNETEQISWGTILPGSSVNTSLYLQSQSNIDTAFQKNETDWTFSNSKGINVTEPADSTPYMNFTWDYDNSTIHPGEAIKITMTLTVDGSDEFIRFLISHDVQRFTVEITITATP